MHRSRVCATSRMSVSANTSSRLGKLAVDCRADTRYYSPYPMPFDAGTPAPQSKGKGKKRKEPGDNTTPRPRTPLASARSANDVMAVGVGKDGEGARGRLWVCDVSCSTRAATDQQLCFKYMRTRAGWEHHTVSSLGTRGSDSESTCNQMRPPGRKVYQRGSYTIWEVDGANATVSRGMIDLNN